MRRTKITVGTGITSREGELISFHDSDEPLTLEELEEELEVWREIARHNDLHEFLYGIAQEAMSILHKAGLPTNPTLWYEYNEDGRWRILTEDRRRDRKQHPPPGGGWSDSLRDVVAAWLKARDRPEDSREAYAARGLGCIKSIRHHLAAGNSELACRLSIDLGAMITECRIKTEWELSALRGRAFAPKGRGINEITKLIDQALRELGPKVSTNEVFLYVRANAPPGMIDNIDEADLSIEWHDHAGLVRTMIYPTFTNRVSWRRKKM